MMCDFCRLQSMHNVSGFRKSELTNFDSDSRQMKGLRTRLTKLSVVYSHVYPVVVGTHLQPLQSASATPVFL